MFGMWIKNGPEFQELPAIRPRSHYGKNAASASESWAFPWQLMQRGKFERQTLLRLTWGNRLRCRWWEWRLAEKQCLSSKISFKTFVFAWVEQLFDIRLFKVCFVPSFCSTWVRGPTRPRLLCSEPGGRARRFLRRKWCRERTSCLSGSSANWSL